MRDIVELVASRSGLDESEARRAIESIEEAIAPGRHARAEELRLRLERRLGVNRARAIELVEIVCQAIAARLDRDERAQLTNRLRDDLHAFFDLPPSVAATATREPGLARAGHTLADGRPGSRHPLSESRPAGRVDHRRRP
jgi:hypothetical protein